MTAHRDAWIRRTWPWWFGRMCREARALAGLARGVVPADTDREAVTVKALAAELLALATAVDPHRAEDLREAAESLRREYSLLEASQPAPLDAGVEYSDADVPPWILRCSRNVAVAAFLCATVLDPAHPRVLLQGGRSCITRDPYARVKARAASLNSN